MSSRGLEAFGVNNNISSMLWCKPVFCLLCVVLYFAFSCVMLVSIIDLVHLPTNIILCLSCLMFLRQVSAIAICEGAYIQATTAENGIIAKHHGTNKSIHSINKLQVIF